MYGMIVVYFFANLETGPIFLKNHKQYIKIKNSS
jgi:YHS domain-containing protein